MEYSEKDLKIVKVNNPFDFDFTGELGARFGGRDFIIVAGGSLTCPLTLAEHLAKHLAQAHLLKEENKRKAQPGDDLRQIWNETIIDTLAKQLITDVTTQTKPTIKTEAEIMEERVKSLNTEILSEEEDGEVETPESVETTDEENVDGEDKVVYKDKAQVIAELKKRNITFDPRSTKATLETLLK